MPSHSVKQAKVMSAIAHGWHPDQGSVAKIPLKVAKEFHAADAGHKYGKGHDKKKMAEGGYVPMAEGGLAQFSNLPGYNFRQETGKPALDPETLMQLLNPYKKFTKTIPAEDVGGIHLPTYEEPAADIKGTELPEYIGKGRTMASGGSMGGFNPERGEAIGLAHQGAIKSSVPGRTDKLNLNVLAGSSVVPADVVSGLGQGNTDAGHSILAKMFTKGPYGMNLPKTKSGSRVGGRHSSLSFTSKFAAGGQVGKQTPIVAAGGEHVLDPDQVSNVGNGDLDLGHKILNAFYEHVRKRTVKTLRKLPGPKNG